MIEVADTAVPCEISPAVNFNDRRCPIDILLLHYTGMPDGEGAQRWLCAEESGVSCHYIVHEDGRVVQMVPETKRAWHAGAGNWQGRDDINSRSIGIEIVNPGHEFGYADFPPVQVDAVIALSRDILSRHRIVPRNVLGHSDTAPGRKVDPGEKFPWRRLNGEGIGVWVEPEPISGGRFMALGDSGPPVAALREMLNLYGYGIEEGDAFDAWTQTVVSAFQRHFRPALIDGVADTSTIETLYRLLSEVR